MVYYVSVADRPTARFLGAAFVHAESHEEAAAAAAQLVPEETPELDLRLLVGDVGPSDWPIPAIGRWLTREELLACGPCREGEDRLLVR
jgi:hypothetical protein